MNVLAKYLLIALSAVVGVLVIALRIQGGKLHAAQISLLRTTIESGQEPLDKAVLLAKARLKAALKSYQGK